MSRTISRSAPSATSTLCVFFCALLSGLSVSACGAGPAPADVLRNQILAELHADVRIAPHEIQVEVVQIDPGHVVLSGTVDQPEVKQLAERITRDLSGVDRVDNQIDVRGPRAGT